MQVIGVRHMQVSEGRGVCESDQVEVVGPLVGKLVWRTLSILTYDIMYKYTQPMGTHSWRSHISHPTGMACVANAQSARPKQACACGLVMVHTNA